MLQSVRKCHRKVLDGSSAAHGPRAIAWLLTIAVPAAVLLAPVSAQAWTIGSQLDYTGCHEKITTKALRAVREMFATAPRIAPTRDEAALIDEVQFLPPSDFVDDLAAMSLLLGVRDNDLKGKNPLDALDLVQVHGNPDTQEEHCIRAATDDGDAGNDSALAACRGFIVMRATEALSGLGDDGTVDASRRMQLPVYVSFAGHVTPQLPLFYVRIGQAMHALEDGFTHTYRTTDGTNVTYVTNWIDYVTGSTPDEARDGPPHLSALDHCEGPDPLVARNFDHAVEAATRLLALALDPSMTPESKVAAFDVLTVEYLTYQPGCTVDNHYCDAEEPKVQNPSGCNAGGAGASSWLLAIAFVMFASRHQRRRKRATTLAIGLAMFGIVASVTPAGADTAAPCGGTTTTDQAKVSVAKELGNPLGFAAMVGGSPVHGAAAVTVAARYRVSERWLVGVDAEWNPWFTSAPLTARAGVASAYLTVVRRFPMKFERVNLRISAHLGASMLLFDVNGAPKYDVGPFGSFTPLGIDYDLGQHVRLVLDPIEVAMPMPHVGLIPLFYEQFRMMIGIQIGA